MNRYFFFWLVIMIVSILVAYESVSIFNEDPTLGAVLGSMAVFIPGTALYFYTNRVMDSREISSSLRTKYSIEVRPNSLMGLTLSDLDEGDIVNLGMDITEGNGLAEYSRLDLKKRLLKKRRWL